jgi:hypothetical protein
VTCLCHFLLARVDKKSFIGWRQRDKAFFGARKM